MTDALGKFCPVCGKPRPTIVSKRLHLTKNQRFKCDECRTEFTIHVDEGEIESQVEDFFRNQRGD